MMMSPPAIPALAEEDPRFFIALMPPSAVQAAAQTVADSLHDCYQMRTAKAPPHVTLQPPFRWAKSRLAELEKTIAAFAIDAPPIALHLDGFGCFKPRVLYVNVKKTPTLLQVQSGLMQHLEQTLGIPAERRSFSPHLTIASRNVKPSTFKLAWAELQQQSIAFDFCCSELTLLIYVLPTGWQIYKGFQLCGDMKDE